MAAQMLNGAEFGGPQGAENAGSLSPAGSWLLGCPQQALPHQLPRGRPPVFPGSTDSPVLTKIGTTKNKQQSAFYPLIGTGSSLLSPDRGP